MKSKYEKLGNFIREVVERNSDLSVTNLIGVSMEKKFISSVANMVGVDMSIYKIIRKGQFACKLMSVGRDEKLPVDLYRADEPAIVSSAYYVFESVDENILLNEYLFIKNYYFMAGDYLFNSIDSRYWGLLPEDHIIGKALFIWKSIDPSTDKYRFKRFFKKII